MQPPTPSWGNILSDAQNFYHVAWWYVVFPALALLITTLAFNLLGDGIRDALDPRTERLLAVGTRQAQAQQEAQRGCAERALTCRHRARGLVGTGGHMAIVGYLIRRILTGIVVSGWSPRRRSSSSSPAR